MADITKREKLAKESLYNIGYEYLRNNFHKFNERNKIKVAISILQIFEKDDSKSKSPIDIKVIFGRTEAVADDSVSAPRFAAPSIS